MDIAGKIKSTRDVLVFSKSYCPYCKNLAKFLANSDTPHEMIQIDKLDDGGRSVQSYMVDTYKHKTVPVVFYDGHYIGTSDNFYVWFKNNKL